MYFGIIISFCFSNYSANWSYMLAIIYWKNIVFWQCLINVQILILNRIHKETRSLSDLSSSKDDGHGIDILWINRIIRSLKLWMLQTLPKLSTILVETQSWMFEHIYYMWVLFHISMELFMISVRCESSIRHFQCSLCKRRNPCSLTCLTCCSSTNYKLENMVKI